MSFVDYKGADEFSAFPKVCSLTARMPVQPVPHWGFKVLVVVLVAGGEKAGDVWPTPWSCCSREGGEHCMSAVVGTQGARPNIVPVHFVHSCAHSLAHSLATITLSRSCTRKPFLDTIRLAQFSTVLASIALQLRVFVSCYEHIVFICTSGYIVCTGSEAHWGCSLAKWGRGRYLEAGTYQAVLEPVSLLAKTEEGRASSRNVSEGSWPGWE